MSEIPIEITKKLQRAFRALEAFASASEHQVSETVGNKPVTRKRLEELEQKEKNFQEEISRIEADIYAAKTRLRDLKGGERDYDIEKRQHETITQNLETEIHELESEKKKLEEKIRQIEEKIELNKSKISMEEIRIQEFQSQTGLKAKELSSIEDQIKALEEGIKKNKSEIEQNSLEKAEVATKLAEIERKARLNGDNSGMSLDRVRVMLEESKRPLEVFINKEKTEERKYHNLMADASAGGRSLASLRAEEMDANIDIGNASRKAGNMSLSSQERDEAKRELAELNIELNEIRRKKIDAERVERSASGRYDPKELKKAEELRKQIELGLLKMRALNDKPEFRGIDLIE